MTNDLGFYTRRFNKVVFYCEYAYYDAKDKLFRCAIKDKRYSRDGSMCFKKCRDSSFKPHIIEGDVVDLRSLNE